MIPASDEAVQDAASEQIRQLEKERYDALLAADTGALNDTLSSRLVYAHSSGYRDTKDTLLTKLGDGTLRYLTLEHPEDDIVILGDTAMVVGQMRGTVEVGGATRELNNLALAVWAREDGNWRLVAYAPTPIS